MDRPRFWTLTALIVLAAASRLVPHPENVAPVAALALFGAAMFRGKLAGVAIPIGAMLLSDLVMQATFQAGWQPRTGVYPGQWVVYVCMGLTAGMGFLLQGRRTFGPIALATLGSSLVFFLATNFVYFYGSDSMYPRTLAGLVECYQMALPFYRNSLAGDLAYTAILFGGFALAELRIPALRHKASPIDQAAWAA